MVKVLSTRKNIVYLLWGNPAQLKYVMPSSILFRCFLAAFGGCIAVSRSILICLQHQLLRLYVYANVMYCRCQGIDGKNNTMITTSHPSPLGAYKTSSPFMGSRYNRIYINQILQKYVLDGLHMQPLLLHIRCFSRCNDALEAYGKDPIDWNIEK